MTGQAFCVSVTIGGHTFQCRCDSVASTYFCVRDLAVAVPELEINATGLMSVLLHLSDEGPACCAAAGPVWITCDGDLGQKNTPGGEKHTGSATKPSKTNEKERELQGDYTTLQGEVSRCD
jgi:hypothetical protein